LPCDKKRFRNLRKFLAIGQHRALERDRFAVREEFAANHQRLAQRGLLPSLARRRITEAKWSMRALMMASNRAALLAISQYRVLVETPARGATLSILVAA